MNDLRRYWFQLEADGQSLPFGAVMGCGVTAIDLDDALKLVGQHLFEGRVFRTTRIDEDVDVSTLDPGHVLPNMGDVTARGIWFPLGYS